MASVKITELASSGPLTGSEVLPIVQGNETVKTTVQEIGVAGRPYKVYTALLTQSGSDNSNVFVSSGLLTIGVTYVIDEIISGNPDWTNVGAPNNEVGTKFVATGTTPNSWGEDATLYYSAAAPVVTVLENTIGNVWFGYNDTGVYNIFSSELFIGNKTICSLANSFNGGAGDPNSNIIFYSQIASDSSINIFSPANGTLTNDLLYNTPIEIRVYN